MLGVEILAPVNRTGVGMHVQHLLAELMLAKVARTGTIEPMLTCHGKFNPEGTGRVVAELVRGCLDDNQKYPQLTVVIDLPVKGRSVLEIARAKTKVLYTVFELRDPAQTRVSELRGYDEIWTPSEWGRQVLQEHGWDKTIRVVPEGTNTHEMPRHLISLQDPGCTVMSVGKCEKRKGQDLLLDALDMIQGISVTVRALWNNPWDEQAAHKLLIDRGWFPTLNDPKACDAWSKNGHVISLMDRVASDTDWQAIAMESMCAIFPHRGEGWGIPILDCIGLGVPTFATNASGPTPYLTMYYSGWPGILKPQLLKMERVNDPVFFPGSEGYWVSPDPQEIADFIVHSHTMSKQGRRDVATWGRKVGDYFSWEKSAAKFAAACQAAYAEGL